MCKQIDRNNDAVSDNSEDEKQCGERITKLTQIQ